MTLRAVVLSRVEFEKGSGHKAVRVRLHPDDRAEVLTDRDFFRSFTVRAGVVRVAGLELVSDPDVPRGEMRFSHE